SDKTEYERAGDRRDGEEKSGAPCLHDFGEIHSEAEEDDGGLQEELGGFGVVLRIRMAERQRKDESECERERRRRPRRHAKKQKRREERDASCVHQRTFARKRSIVRRHASAAASALNTSGRVSLKNA